MGLSEGFAEFLPGQYWGTTLGPHAAEDYYLDEYPQYLQIDARRRMPLAALGSNNIYPKGALVLRMLHATRSEEHTSELQSHLNLVCRLLLEKKKTHRYVI